LSSLTNQSLCLKMALKMLVIGNWKSNGSHKLCESFIRDLKCNGNVVICPPAIYLANMVHKISCVEIGAQDCSSFTNGPYTGDISCELLKGIGIKYVIIGHSERIRFHHETVNSTLDKVHRCLEHNIIPIVCVDDDYQNIIDKLSFNEQILIAYEPISSIGTGILPDNKHIDIISSHIKSFGKFKTLYGGSVTSKNIDSLKSIKSLDGVLVGGASLIVSEFQLIVDSCK